MNVLENPAPIWAGGAVLATLAAIAFFARRDLPTLGALVATVLVAGGLLVVERLVVTPAEEVEAAVLQIVAAVGANDEPGVVALLDPGVPGLAAGVEAAMSRVRVEDAGATSLVISVTNQQAESRFRGRLDGVHTSSGQRVFYFDEVVLDWTNASGRWLLTDYRLSLQGKPVDLQRWGRR